MQWPPVLGVRFQVRKIAGVYNLGQKKKGGPIWVALFSLEVFAARFPET
jgi:hypothetical protein